MIGLSGSHRTGKTTLAKMYAEMNGIDFVQTDSAGVFARMGLDPREDYPFAVRLDIQREILNDAALLYIGNKHQHGFITDRTPLDMLAYTTADVQRSNLTAEDSEAFMKYQKECFDITNRHFVLVMVVQPGIPLVEARGKAPAIEAYMEHINSLVMGLSVDPRMKTGRFYIGRDNIAMSRRINAMDYAWQRVEDSHTRDFQEAGGIAH